jgi:hypothetical protein
MLPGIALICLLRSSCSAPSATADHRHLTILDSGGRTVALVARRVVVRPLGNRTSGAAGTAASSTWLRPLGRGELPADPQRPTQVARRARARARGARDGRRRDARDRVPGLRDHRDRATDRASRPFLARDPTVDERARPRDPRPHLKQGSVRARHALVKACWTAVGQPGPLHAFYVRVRARRAHSVAVVAAARKLACLFWCLLTRRTGLRLRPAVADQKEAAPPADHRRATPLSARGRRHPARQRRRPPGRARARPPGRVRLPRALCATTTPARPHTWARVRHRGAHQIGPRRAKPRGRPQAPDVCASLRQSLAPTRRSSAAVPGASSGDQPAIPALPPTREHRTRTRPPQPRADLNPKPP